ncbi:tRNA-splicing endonuclease subunit Sen2 [Zootermopsis nevadensis]|uniref:tRNA-splicing endonuclease subunit Sen2 n=1 Tax=Zootermopsis nevadensis TaxID=136037 RepID=A0A067RTA0_ZOONE|nr:tRNA-splicing endonuclease subunit Sen2 [Zootermopsis nevadensis]XP_021920592.1 tRNA-splicing endonuclease subunit Sen2 [Zootermopsis nevadensis]XP_021920602.1 tRNA-splicing endonuclease subunit Sen2 [Zootermopsis nevadensis]KDR24040.1 tRNA-splicing endonuclease subunit Sen2 [Zootermopsis nevadensis]
MELREPKRKCRVRVSLQQPFPVLNRDVTAIPTNKALWQVYTGKFSGDCVVVDAPDEMVALHNMGFFGKGSLSRGGPQFDKERRGIPPFIRHRQWKRRCKWAEQQEAMKNDDVKVSSIQDSVMAGHVTSEIIVTKENQASESSANAILEDKTQDENSKKVCDVNSIVKTDDEIKTNSTEKILNNSNGSIVKKANDTVEKIHDIVNIYEEIITLDSLEEDDDNPAPVGSESEQRSTLKLNNLNNANEQNRIAQEKCQSPEENNTISVLENDRAEEGITEEYDESSDDRSEERMLLVLPDSDSDYEGYLNDVCPKLEKEQFPVCETLHLTLEEAFFLSFGLGCLQVVDLFGNCLSLDGMWQLFCKSQKDFIQKYVAYHYFRSKGWVVKPGIKFGGDFLLYKQGPPFYHASYIVLVEVADKFTLMRITGLQRNLSWTRLMGLNRVGESARKEILFCQVIWPSDASPESMELPSILSKFQVHEVLVRRWISSQEREESDVS